MKANKSKPATIDEYIAQFPADVQLILEKLRAVIREVAPQAVEKISYQMPSFYLNGYLVGFAVHKLHVGFYPVPSGILAFQPELAAYKTSKGTAQFYLDRPIPYELIRKIVEFRVAENLKK
jgi:uncharacterized protein YdhG (YjbR/CyaY superfamily)